MPRKTDHVERKTLTTIITLFVVLVTFLGLSFDTWGQFDPIGTNQNVLIICVKYSDFTTTRMGRCADWRDLLSNETNTFYNQATFNQTNFAFETTTSGTDGWVDLGFPSTEYDFDRIAQTAIDSVDPVVDFNQFRRVVIITNSPNFGGQGDQVPYWYHTDEGAEGTFEVDGENVDKRRLTICIVNEWQAGPSSVAGTLPKSFDEGGSVIAHEMGHNLGAPTHYADLRWYPGIGRDVITPWDVMGFSPTLNHFIGWAKADRGWVPGTRIQTIGPPSGSNINTTITLKPLESGTSGTQLIKVPFTSSGPFIGYIVENRRTINGDQNLPSQGVLISLLDESDCCVKTFVLLDPNDAATNENAPLEVGDSFNDAGRDLTITVVSQSGDDYDVRIQYNLPPSAKPDPMIIPWGAPPWESVDMWVDSEKNGWDTYRYTDGAGNPVGNGDDAWVNRDNRFYVRIRNIGPGTATNVRVQVFSNSPPGMGDAGPDWAYLGTIVIPNLTAGATAQDFVIWKPTVGEHTCIKAVIEDIPGELSPSNNLAQENVSAFDSSTSSTFEPVTLKAHLYNPLEKDKLLVRFNLRDLPRGWAAKIDPLRVVIEPGGKRSVHVTIFPSGLPSKQHLAERFAREYQVGYLARPKIEALGLYADTFIPIGGIEMWTHLVSPSKLWCRVEGQQTQVRPPIYRVGPMTEVKLATIQTFARPIVRKPEKRVVTKANAVVVIQGVLSPAGSTMIAVEFRKGGERILRHVRTDAKGAYRVQFKPPSPGIWQAQAFWAGDNTHAAAESGFCGFEVGRKR